MLLLLRELYTCWYVEDKGHTRVSTIDYFEASKTIPHPQGAHQRLIELSMKTKKT